MTHDMSCCVWNAGLILQDAAVPALLTMSHAAPKVGTVSLLD